MFITPEFKNRSLMFYGNKYISKIIKRHAFVIQTKNRKKKRKVKLQNEIQKIQLKF